MCQVMTTETTTGHEVPCPLCGAAVVLRMQMDSDCEFECPECNEVVPTGDIEDVVAVFTKLLKVQAAARKLMSA